MKLSGENAKPSISKLFVKDRFIFPNQTYSLYKEIICVKLDDD